MSKMLKKVLSFVLASFKASTYHKGTCRLFARCGLAENLFEHLASLLSTTLRQKFTADTFTNDRRLR
jgi:hypothetical protein